MAYFSNNTDGSVLEELCMSCIHGWDAEAEKNRQAEPCAVFLLQMQWNYNQLDREKHGTITAEYRGGQITTSYPIGEYTREAIIRKQALDALVPNKNGTLCSMFVPIKQE